MLTGGTVHHRPMSKGTDQALRDRITAWLRHYERIYRSQTALADKLGVSSSAVNQIMSGKRNAGLDILAKMHTNLGVSADALIDTDPPRQNGHAADPTMASQATVEQGRRRKVDG